MNTDLFNQSEDMARHGYFGNGHRWHEEEAWYVRRGFKSEWHREIQERKSEDKRVDRFIV